MERAVLNPLFVNREGLAGYVVVRGCLEHNDHMSFQISEM